MIRIKDLTTSLDFYCSKLGLEEVSRSENEKGRFTLIFLSDPVNFEQAKESKSPLIELTYNWPDENGYTEDYEGGRNFGHLAFKVDNIYEYCEAIQKKGVILNRPPRDGHMAFIKSPDGISIELLQKGEALDICEPWMSMQNIGTW
jgi:lactoylglutathione lyase